MATWEDEFHHELELAGRARAQHNEGRARVCARRAGGAAAREYLARRGEAVAGKSAYDLLKLLADTEGLPERARRSALLLTLRVDEGFRLPADVDLLDEACALYEVVQAALET